MLKLYLTDFEVQSNPNLISVHCSSTWTRQLVSSKYSQPHSCLWTSTYTRRREVQRKSASNSHFPTQETFLWNTMKPAAVILPISHTGREAVAFFCSETQTPPRVCQCDSTVLLEVLTHPKSALLRVADCNSAGPLFLGDFPCSESYWELPPRPTLGSSMTPFL